FTRVVTERLDRGRVAAGTYIVETLRAHVHSVLRHEADIPVGHEHGKETHEIEGVILELLIQRHLVVPNVGEVLGVFHLAARLAPYSSLRVGAQEYTVPAKTVPW